MSANNGIYILELKDQARVIHTNNIENIYYCYCNFDDYKEVPTRIVELFCKCESYNLRDARDLAFKMEEEISKSKFPNIECGINTIRIPKTWDEILLDAKRLVKLEIDILKLRLDNGYYNSRLENLKDLVAKLF